MNYFYTTYFLLFCLLGLSQLAKGQIHISPIARNYKKVVAPGARTEGTPLSLPFWDDFSTSRIFPNSDRWINSEDVFVGDGMSVNPPSIFTASFDGTDAAGKPYSLDTSSDGPTDRLTSQPIDLSLYVPADKIYMSFFYQAKGEGEIPNKNDSLRLEFKQKNGLWKTAWSVTGADILTDTFQIVSLPVTDTSFFHIDFQFRFTSYGRQSGPFDTWHLDYIYLNKNVTKFDFPDRALRAGPSSIFKNYTAVPIHHFNTNPDVYLDISKARAYNLFDSLQPSNFTLLAYLKSTKKDASIQFSVDTLSFETTSSFPNPLTAGVRGITLTAENRLNAIKVNSDSLCEITLQLYMNTDDNQPPDYQPQYSPLDFRVNDTISTTQFIHDYYAYDDGTAEFGAGLNYPGDKVAYQFPMTFHKKDTLVSIDMYFPNIGNESGNKVIDLFVWNTLKDNSTLALHQQTIAIKPSGINEFITYELSEAVLVQDTFYIGWKQTQTGNLDIGLDKNTDSGDKIYYNLDGTWQQNTKVKGSLMLRPRFGSADIILGMEETASSGITIYPNPGRGLFTVNGEVKRLEVYNFQGQLIRVSPFEKNDAKSTFSLENERNGLYIIKIYDGKNVVTRKLILDR